MVTSDTKQTAHKERVRGKTAPQNVHQNANTSPTNKSQNTMVTKTVATKDSVGAVTREIIKFPLSTEKTVRLMESENKLLFEVALDATKSEVKAAVEKLFKVKVVAVRTMITPDYKKRAAVRFAQDTPAIDIATELGLI